MKIAFEVDARLVVVTSLAGVIVLFALHGAYPGMFGFWPASSQDLAAWVQAVGSIAAIVGAIWISEKQSREKKSDDLMRAQWAAAGMAVRLNRYATELSNFAAVAEFSDDTLEHPEIDDFMHLQNWLEAPRYRPSRDEFAEIISLPNRAAHRLARGYELIAVLQERLKKGSAMEVIFRSSSHKARRAMLEGYYAELHKASELISVAAHECEEAMTLGAPIPTYAEKYGDENP